MKLPRYPIYIPSKGRFDHALTARIFVEDEVPFYLVIEEEEHDRYAARFDESHLLVLPFSNAGSVIPARNWIRQHAEAAGHERHWQFDDNIQRFRRLYRGERIPIRSGLAISMIEDWTDRYTNIAISGFNYQMFVVPPIKQPIFLNCHVYSATLVNHAMPYWWRGRYNEDTDLCLQALAGGWCTALFNAVMVDKIATMKVPGGNSAELYQGDGRLKMARALERMWPGVVTTKRRFNRPQHVVASSWKKFDTKLIRRTDIEWPEGVDEHGMRLRAVAEVETPRLRKLLDEAGRDT